MTYLPTTPEIQKDMLKIINKKSIDGLLDIIPNTILLKSKMGLHKSMSELEITEHIKHLTKDTIPANTNNNYIGNGIYDHFIPAGVDAITSRSEFYTAYTPYQPEVSQGTLQSLYEYQTIICELSGMDAANASLYDGASSLTEACILAINSTKKNKILISETIYDHYIDVVSAMQDDEKLKIEIIPMDNGITDFKRIKDLDNIAALIVQSPNKYGLLEDWELASKFKNECNFLLISISNPLMLTLIEPPGICGADIYVGEGQVFGNSMNYGGPCLGIIAVKEKYIRNLPGRIVGRTIDKRGKEGFVLTLQTREQHIRRDRASSNICTNQGLMALRALIHINLLGKIQLERMAKLCFYKTHYLINNIKLIKGYTIPFEKNIIMEFLVKPPIQADMLVKEALKENIFLKTLKFKKQDHLLIAVTEKRTKSQLDDLINFFKKY